MSGIEAVGLSISVARLCNDLAWGLRNFIHKVKGAPEQARHMQHSLVALKKCLDKIKSLFAFRRPLDPQEETFRDSILDILKSVDRDLATMRSKLQLDKMLGPDNRSFWRDAKTVFESSFEEDDIKEIQVRIGKYERLLQTHFEMLLLLSSWKTQEKVDSLVEVVQEVFVRLLEDAKGIETHQRLRAVRRHFDHRIEEEADDCDSDAGTVAESESGRQYLGALGWWQECSKDVVESVTNGSSRRRRSSRNAPSVLDETNSGYPTPDASDSDGGWAGPGEPSSLVPTASPRTATDDPPAARFPAEPDPPQPPLNQYRPEEQEKQGQLKIELDFCQRRAQEMLEAGNLAEAAKHQQESIDVRTELKEPPDFPFSEECEMKETLADIHVRMETPEGMQKAHGILRCLVEKEDSLGENGDDERRSRLYQTLSGIELRLGKFNEACISAQRAAYTRLQANSVLSLEEKELVKEAARTCYKAAMQIPNYTKAFGTFQHIALKLGDPTFTAPKDPNDEITLAWCRQQGFRVDDEGFGYHVCDTAAPGDVRGFSPIHQAIKENKMDKLQHMLLFPRNLEVRLQTPYDDATPLLLACSERNLEAVKLLLEKGAKVDAKDGAGNNGLHRCQVSKPGGIEIARLLLEHKKSGSLEIEERDQHHRTAVHLAAQTGNVEMLNFLLRPEQGANPNVQQPDGSTPLMVAVLSDITNKASVVRALLNNKADSTIRNKNRQSVEDIAKARREKVVLRLLEARAEQGNSPQGKSRRNSASPSVLSNTSVQTQTTCLCPHCAVHGAGSGGQGADLARMTSVSSVGSRWSRRLSRR